MTTAGRECSTSPWMDGRTVTGVPGPFWVSAPVPVLLSVPRTQLIRVVVSAVVVVPKAVLLPSVVASNVGSVPVVGQPPTVVQV